MSQYPECPNCGETVAEPVTVHSREWQGDEAHGGIVEWEDEMCELCMFESKMRECEQFTDAEITQAVAERKKELLRDAEPYVDLGPECTFDDY